jgi:hypothetical protein
MEDRAGQDVLGVDGGLLLLQPLRQLFPREGMGVAPGLVVLRSAGDRAEHGPLAAGSHEQLHGVEEPRIALGHGRLAAVGVPEVLLDGLGHGLGRAGLLALHQGKRYAVHEQDLVGNDELPALAAGNVYPELRDDHEVVVVRVSPVDVIDALVPAAVPARHALDRDAVQ